VLLLELEPARLRDKQTSVERVALLLQDLGYALFFSRRRTLEPLRHLPEGDDAQMNVFCLPQPGVVSNGDLLDLRAEPSTEQTGHAIDVSSDRNVTTV
jgi:hypothetical protein